MNATPAIAITLRHRLTAILIGLAVPAGAFSHTALTGVAFAALLAGLSVPDRRDHLRRLLLAVRFHPVGILAAAMVLLWLPNIAVSPVPTESAATWARIVLALAGATYLWSILDRNPRLRGLAQDSLVLGLLATLTASVAGLIAAPQLVAQLRNVVGDDSPWMRYRAFASVVACAVPVIAWIAWNRRGWRRIAALLACVPATILLIGSGAQAALVALGLAAAFLLFLVGLRNDKLRAPVAVAGGAVAAGFAALLLKDSGTTVLSTGAIGLPVWLVDLQRQNIWMFIVERIPDAPWFGRGLNAIVHIPGADHLVPGMPVAFPPTHPHNWVLEMVAEAGIVGFLLPLALVFGLTVAQMREVVLGAGARRIARHGMFLVFWGVACFNFSIWAPWWGVSFLFLYLIASARPATAAEAATPKMLVVVGEASDFLARRITLANAAAEAGYAVEVVCEGRSAQRQKLETLGLPLHRWSFQRFSVNPWRAFQAIDALRRIYEAATPTLVHHVGPKPVVFGAIAARLAGVPLVLGTFDGADFPFSGRREGTLARRWLRPLSWGMDRPGARLLAQNPEDAAAAIATRVTKPERIGVMPGAGVDTETFRPSPEPEAGPAVATVATRMLWSKGLRETAAAAKLLQERDARVAVRLIGDIDPDNPDNVHPATLSLWNADGWIAWTGSRPDMPAVWAETNIAVLASYHEGVPQSLMEAAACGRASVATDVPGCRSLVIDGETGVLVPPRDPEALADAIAALAADPARRAAMGAAARAKVETEFAASVIEARMIALYRELAATGAA